MKLTSLTLCLLLGACAAHEGGGPTSASSSSPAVPAVTLASTSGEHASYPQDLAAAPFTVFVFFSKDCLCFSAHEQRLRMLVDTYRPRGVRVVLVDPETGRTVDGDAAEARTRNLPAPIFIDPGARLAAALGAKFATYSVVVDQAGRVRYHGGFDSDKTHLSEGRTAFLADALDDLVAGREPRVAEGKTLGCVLQTW
jgi:hypothetical protein